MKKYEECQDDELIRRLRDGDGSVMDYLMEKYKDLVRRKARLMYLPGADQEDLIQEGMIGLFKAVRGRVFFHLCRPLYFQTDLYGSRGGRTQKACALKSLCLIEPVGGPGRGQTGV